MRRWILGFAVLGSAWTLVGAADAAARPATLATFAGSWGGHDRGLSINRWGRGFAQVNSGAGCPCFGVAFQLSHVEGKTDSATATATVVRLYGTRHGYPAPSPLPRIGQRVVLRLRHGKIEDPLTRENYCGAKAKGTAPCGA
jgi:hypothetical protein